MGEVTVADVRAWAVRCADRLAAAREVLDAANVFPVPDHDTGTNLADTARAAAEALLGTDADDVPGAAGDLDVAGALRRLATGAVRSARGNSGVILSQVLRGFADSAATGHLDLHHALTAAATAARSAVADPVEGTMLTVADAAAGVGPGAPAEVARAAALAARTVVEDLHAPGRPAALGSGADAGAQGLVLVYEALAEVLSGEPASVPPVAPAVTPEPQPVVAAHTGTPGGPAYEVQYLLDLPAAADAPAVIGRLADTLRPLGDSLVLADDGAGLWAVHVHVDDVGAAIEAGAVGVARGGAMSQVRVTRFADDATPVPSSDPPGGRSAVVVATGADVGPARTLFVGLPVTVLGPGDPFPSGELVVVAVGDSAIVAAMRHADRAAGVSVVPARALVQAVAAVAVHDPTRRGVDDTVAMAEAAAGCRTASFVVADADGLTIVGVAHAGDVLGLIGDEIAVIGADHDDVAGRLLDRLLAGGGELVTLLHRTDSADLAARLAAHVRVLGDHLDVEIRDVGDELASPVLVGVE